VGVLHVSRVLVRPHPLLAGSLLLSTRLPCLLCCRCPMSGLASAFMTGTTVRRPPSVLAYAGGREISSPGGSSTPSPPAAWFKFPIGVFLSYSIFLTTRLPRLQVLFWLAPLVILFLAGVRRDSHFPSVAAFQVDAIAGGGQIFYSWYRFSLTSQTTGGPSKESAHLTYWVLFLITLAASGVPG
jgi:hypothetical protein